LANIFPIEPLSSPTLIRSVTKGGKTLLSLRGSKILLPPDILSLALSTESYGQCAMCKAVVESADAGTLDRTGTGLNSGILYLMAIPYLLLFFLFRKKIITLFKQLV